MSRARPMYMQYCTLISQRKGMKKKMKEKHKVVKHLDFY